MQANNSGFFQDKSKFYHDQTRWLHGPFPSNREYPVCFLQLRGPRAQVICCTSNPSLSLSCLQCFFPGGLEGNVLRLWIVANPNDQRFWTPSHKHGLHSSEYTMLKAPKWTHECIRASSKRVWRWQPPLVAKLQDTGQRTFRCAGSHTTILSSRADNQCDEVQIMLINTYPRRCIANHSNI